jgi:hypothetical protein
MKIGDSSWRQYPIEQSNGGSEKGANKMITVAWMIFVVS